MGTIKENIFLAGPHRLNILNVFFSSDMTSLFGLFWAIIPFHDSLYVIPHVFLLGVSPVCFWGTCSSYEIVRNSRTRKRYQLGHA